MYLVPNSEYKASIRQNFLMVVRCSDAKKNVPCLRVALTGQPTCTERTNYVVFDRQFSLSSPRMNGLSPVNMTHNVRDVPDTAFRYDL